MKQKILNNPWFYFVLSLLHQCLVFLPGEFPVLFPDSGTYFGWNPQRTPLYPLVLSVLGGNKATALLQILLFAGAAALFHLICRRFFAELTLPKGKEKAKDIFIWIGSLYFATNFELIQYTPTILTESLGISLFIFYFFCMQKSMSLKHSSKFYFALTFFIFPLLLFFLRPSFILVPAAISGFFILNFWIEKKYTLLIPALIGLFIYLGSIQSYAYWNRTRLGHIAISDIAQHQIFANYMAQGILAAEAAKGEASPGLKSFGNAYENLDPSLRLSQYSLFEKWAQLYPEKDLYKELIEVNKELLSKRPFAYAKASLRNLSVLIDGRASFNYYPMENRDLPSKIYFWLQFAMDNIFAVLWFTALVYYFRTLRQRALFSNENLIFLTVATQFCTIAILGYSELRRQSIGVASLQMLFVLAMWAYLAKSYWEKKLTNAKV